MDAFSNTWREVSCLLTGFRLNPEVSSKCADTVKQLTAAAVWAIRILEANSSSDCLRYCGFHLHLRKLLLENIHRVCNDDIIISLNECNFLKSSKMLYRIFSLQNFPQNSSAFTAFASSLPEEKVILVSQEEIKPFKSPVMNFLELKIP